MDVVPIFFPVFNQKLVVYRFSLIVLERAQIELAYSFPAHQNDCEITSKPGFLRVIPNSE
jgi:hypothetical protein